MKQAILLPLLLLAACSDGTAERKAATPDPDPLVRAAIVTTRVIGGGIAVSGTLAAREEAAVGAELAGYRVIDVRVDEGDRVRRGDVLATLDPALIEGELARATVAAERAQSEFARVADLTGTGVIAEETIAQRRFEVRAAAAQLADLRARRARLVLRAPVGGLILSRSIRPGEISGGSSTEPYFRIASDALFELDAHIPEAEFSRTRIGQSVPVTLADGTSLTGSIRLISPRVDPQTKLGRVRILLPRSPALRAGGFATGQISDVGTPVSAVPERAIIYRAGGAVISVIGPDRSVQRVAVRTGKRADGWVELIEGPPPGSRIVLSGGGLLLPGDKVRVAETKQ